MKRFLPAIAIVLISCAACAPTPEGGERGKQTTSPSLADLSIFDNRQVHEPQIVLDAEGTPLIVWREKGDDGSDLFISRRASAGPFDEPTRINDEPGTVESFPHDEMRAAIATGVPSRVAVAWADRRGQVRAALSADGGRTFAPSIRLEQTDAAAYRGFPALAFGPSGALHAIWIDSRYAADFAEEPADLFYATIDDGSIAEANLTADQEATVCGCCRTHLDVTPEGAVRSLFRNADAEGYRDIFSTVGAEGAVQGSPRRIGRPLWKLEGCPMSGPIAVGDRVLWPDGSSGSKILMEAGFDSEPARPLFSDKERGDWSPRLSPRAIVTTREAGLVLLPGRPDARLVERDGDRWRTVAEGLPAWATTGLESDGSLLLVGALDGVLRHETHRLAG